MATQLTQIRKGNIVKMDGVFFKVAEMTHITPGNKGGIVQLKMKNLQTGGHINKRFNSTESIETAFLSKRNCQYLYAESDTWVFMDNETYEQFNLGEDVCGDLMKYVALNMDVQIAYLDETPVELELPASVTLEVIEAEPSIKGNTATNVTKLCKVETGLEVKVPPHIGVGEKIKIDTSEGKFLGRAK